MGLRVGECAGGLSPFAKAGRFYGFRSTEA